jgi:PAS domain S-box-containing protein
MPVQFQWLGKDGSPFWVEVSDQNVYDDSGQPVQRVGVMRNLTERMQIQEALRESEARFRVLVEKTHDLVYSVSADGIFTYVSPQVAQFGYTPEEWIGQPISYFLDPEAREEIMLRFRKRVNTGDSSPVAMRWLRKDGSYDWVEVSAKNVYDDSGQPVQRVGVMRNISERMQIQEALRESEAMTRALLNASTASALLIEPDGTVVAMNETLAVSLGQTTDALIGRSIFAVLPADLAKSREAKSKEVIRTGRPVRFEDTRADKWFDNHVYPLFDEAGQVKRLAIYANDITGRKQAEQYLEQAAVTAERERIARDLHDAVTQSLFMASSIAETLPKVWESKPDEARRGLEELRWLTMGALAEMRNMLIEMHPTALTEKTLGVLLKQLTDGLMARTQMLVTVSVAGDCLLPDEVQIALYRITQEALNNIVKHAHASRAIVRLDCTPERTLLSIQDNGRGFDPGAIASDRMGVSNMSERSRAIGAEFKLDSKLGQGTKIAVTWEKMG